MPTEQSTSEDPALLRRQLERERRARRDAEQIGEAATAELWHTVQRLEQAEAELRDRVELTDLTYALSRSLRADLDPQLMLERAVRALGEALEVDRVVVRLADEHHIGDVVTQWVGPGAHRAAPGSQLDPPFRRLVFDHADREEALWIDDLARRRAGVGAAAGRRRLRVPGVRRRTPARPGSGSWAGSPSTASRNRGRGARATVSSPRPWPTT